MVRRLQVISVTKSGTRSGDDRSGVVEAHVRHGVLAFLALAIAVAPGTRLALREPSAWTTRAALASACSGSSGFSHRWRRACKSGRPERSTTCCSPIAVSGR